MPDIEVSSAMQPLSRLAQNRISSIKPSCGRPSSLKRKREQASTASSPPPSPGGENIPPPSSKRHKVSFDPTVIVRYSTPSDSLAPSADPGYSVDNRNSDEKSLEAIRLEVSVAIRKRTQGDDEDFDILCKTITSLNDEKVSVSLLRKYISALGDVVTSLNGKCSAVVHSILDIAWLGRDESFITHYVHFLGSLLSAQVGYCRVVFRMLLGYFRSLPPSTGRLPGYPVVRRPVLRDRMHKTMKYFLHIIPTSSIVLSSVIDLCYPRNPDPAKCYTDYASNLLRLTTYAPELKKEVLSLLLGQVVKIDVQMQVHMDDLEDDLAEALIDGIDSSITSESVDEADLSADDMDDSDSDSDSDDEDESANTAKLRRLKGDVERMDGVLDILFAHYQKIFTHGSFAEKNDAFDGLISQFCLSLLPSYRSRHTQFLLFHFSQTRPEFVDKFAGTCINNMFDKTKPTLIQLAASSYLSSFVSRGARISSVTIGEVFTILLERIDDYRVTHEPGCKGPDPRRHSGYYCMVQAVLYIFCFRWRDLLSDEDIENTFWDYHDSGMDFPWLPGIRDLISINLFSALNPLKVCNQSIVNQFAKVASHLRFIYVHGLLDLNKRIKLVHVGSAAQPSRSGSLSNLHDQVGYQQRKTALSGMTDDSTFQLDAYFPFDPYRLPKSQRWLQGDYVEWKGVPGLDEEEDEEDEDDEDEDDGEEDDGEAESDDEEREEKETDGGSARPRNGTNARP